MRWATEARRQQPTLEDNGSILWGGGVVEKRCNGSWRDKTSKLNLLVLFVHMWARGVDSSTTIIACITVQ